MNALGGQVATMKLSTLQTIAVVLGMIVGLVVLPSSPATAALQSCYGSSCEGLNPSNTVCASDARTILSRNAVVPSGNYGHLELRYSPKCHSNWVRFTAWHGVRAWLGDFSGGIVGGSPWIWRAGVPNSLRGVIGKSGSFGFGQSNWTAMVTANGTTCSSVGIYSTEKSSSGSGSRYSLGTYNAPCIS